MDVEEILSHEQLVQCVDFCIEAQLRGGVGSATIPAIFGGPGVGKTQLYYDYAKWKYHHGSEALGIQQPTVFILTVILAQGDNVDVGGAFAPDFKTGELKHLVTGDILGHIKGVDAFGTRIEDADIIIIFFDELGNASPPMLSAIQSYLEDGMIRGHKKLANVVFVCASNLPEHGCNAKPIPRSLMEGRIVSLYMGVNHRGWLVWSRGPANIDQRIIAAIEWREELLCMFDGKHKGRTQATPRGWQKLSNLMNEGADGKVLDTLAEGCVGKEAWVQTRGFFKMSGLPLFEEIVGDPMGASLPGDYVPAEGPGGQYVTAANVAYRLAKMKHRGEHLETVAAENILKYFGRYHEEIARYALRVCGEANPELAMNAEFSKMQLAHEDLK